MGILEAENATSRPSRDLEGSVSSSVCPLVHFHAFVKLDICLHQLSAVGSMAQSSVELRKLEKKSRNEKKVELKVEKIAMMK